ncbi:tetratricopeptide repeat protein [Actinomyces sp. ICM47]|uniref:tetratricopeptide repeat protein n=1 Tax=Actinomyces sp. ICM47 TaxID=936548 RepID=UPI0025C45220|nr:tetratricopeptide repeat protein [Actinomyces sp. ICM47]
MGDPLLMTVVGVGAALTKVFLRACDAVSAADLVEDGQDLFGALSRVSRRSAGSKDQIESGVSRALAARIQEMHKHHCGQDIDRQLLSGACTEVEIILNEIADDGELLLSAVLNPDSLPAVFHSRASQRRMNIEERAEPYFDELIDAVAAQYAALAPWFPRFKIEAFKSILSGIDEIQENSRLSLDAHAVTQDKIDTLSSKFDEVVRHENKLSRVFFGSRPNVVAENRFVERSEQEHLNALITNPTKQPTVLVGMRGCGKTQLASALAQQCEDKNWSLVAWMNAGSPESITSDLVELARELKIDTSDQPAPKTIIRRLFNRLKSADPSDRLIVFDNVEDINDICGLVPTGNGLRVVATTTNDKGWNYQWDTIRIGVFDREKSIDYLLTATKFDDRDAADALADRLGDLPLAIAQAAATARNKDLSLAWYLQRLDSRGEELVIRPIPGDEYTDDVAMVLWMAVEDTVDSMKNGTKEMARRQLRALALLAESGVPTRWLDPTVEQLDDDETHGALWGTDEDAHDALTELIHRSIVHQSADKATTMLHRLQAQVLRDSWSEEEREQACESAAALLGSVDIDRFRADDSDARFQETRNLIEHLRAFGAQDCFLHLRDYRHFTSALCRAFTHARDLGLVPEVFALKELVNTLHKQVGDSRETLSLLAQLAYAHMYMSDYPTAIRLYKQVLNTCEQILEPNHRDILSTRNDLAYAYYWGDHTDEAIDLFKQVLDDRTRILSSDHEDTLMTGSYLALAYADDGQLERAIALGEQVVKDRDRVLKPDHKHTLVTRNNLADAYKSVGRLTDAIKMYEYVLEARIRTLGNTHHHTRITRNDLAQTYEQAGDLPKAISMYEDLHNDHIRIYGPDHEKTIEVRDRLEAAKRELEQREEDSAAE